MSIDKLKNALPSYAKDISLNLSSVLTEAGASDLSQKQIYAIALSCAYASKNSTVIESMFSEASTTLSDTDIHASKACSQ